MEDDVIAACRRLSDQPIDLTSALPNGPQVTKPCPRLPSKSTAEISVARVLASLSANSEDSRQPQAPTISACAMPVKNTSSIRGRRNLAQKNDKRNNNVIKRTSGDPIPELSTINMSDVNGLGNSLHLNTSITNNVSKGPATRSTVTLPSSVPEPLTVTASTLPAVVSSKHSHYRPMKQPSEINITYDETTKRYVQTVRKSADRRKLMGFPGFRSNADDTSCSRILPITAAVAAKTKESAVSDTTADVPDKRRRRLSLKKENVASSLVPSDEPTSDLSSMEIVTRCCLGTSEAQRVGEHSQPSQAVNPTQSSPASSQPRRMRSAERTGEASKRVPTDSEPLISNPSVDDDKGKSPEELDQSRSLPVTTTRSGRATKPSTKVEKSGDASKISVKDRAAKKSLEKVPTRTSPRKSNDSSCLPGTSSEQNATKKRRGRPRKTDKVTETLTEKKSGRKGRTSRWVDSQQPAPTTSKSAENKSPTRRRQTSSRKNNTRDKNGMKAIDNDTTELSTINVSDINGPNNPVQLSSSAANVAANDVSKRPTAGRRGRPTTRNKSNVPSEMPGRSSSSLVLTLPVKRKRPSSSPAEDVETAAHDSEQPVQNNFETLARSSEQPFKNVVRLPDIGCFLTDPAQNSNVDAETVIDSNASKNMSEASDGSSQQCRHTSALTVTPIVCSSEAFSIAAKNIGCAPDGGLQQSSRTSTLPVTPIVCSTEVFLCISKNISEAPDGSLQQNSQPITPTVSSTETVVSERDTEHSSPTNCMLPTDASTACIDYQMSSTASIPHSSSLRSSSTEPVTSILSSTEAVLSERDIEHSSPTNSTLPPNTSPSSSECQMSYYTSIPQSSSLRSSSTEPLTPIVSSTEAVESERGVEHLSPESSTLPSNTSPSLPHFLMSTSASVPHSSSQRSSCSQPVTSIVSSREAVVSEKDIEHLSPESSTLPPNTSASLSNCQMSSAITIQHFSSLRSSFTEPLTSIVSSMEAVASERDTEHSSPAITLPRNTSPSFSKCQMSSATSIPSLRSSGTCVLEPSADDANHAAVSNADYPQENGAEMISGQSSSLFTEMENHISISNSTHLSCEYFCLYLVS